MSGSARIRGLVLLDYRFAPLDKATTAGISIRAWQLSCPVRSVPWRAMPMAGLWIGNSGGGLPYPRHQRNATQTDDDFFY